MSPSQEAPIRTAAAAAAYLEGLINLEKRPTIANVRLSLAPIQALLERLGNPERGLRVIHITGSKGKGSTALFAEALLNAAGLRAGTFTSPHLESWTERFRIEGSAVDEERLAGAVDRLRPHVEALRQQGSELAPTFFDATTATALLLFREARVDCAILEVGLGGRLDSTNIVVPAVSCVTSIELEHTELLGATLSAIAREKAGIVKPGVPVVIGALCPEAAAEVEKRARECGAEIAMLGRDFHAESRSTPAQRVRFLDGPVEIDAELRVHGAHQIGNAALALACVRRSGTVHDAELVRVAAAGLAAAELPGRVEILGQRPWIVVDGAHTGASSRALADALLALPRSAGARTHFVLSVSAGKNLEAILDALLPLAASITVTRAEPIRSLSLEAIATAVRNAAPGVALRAVPDPELAVATARAELSADDCLCVTGSIYLAGIARRILTKRDQAADVRVTRDRAIAADRLPPEERKPRGD